MNQSQPAQAQRGTIVTIAVWIAAAAFAPLFTRLILLGTEVRDAAWVDLRGVGSDLIVAMLVAPLLAWLSRRFLLAEGATLLWALMWHGNFEHIAALDANAALHYVRYLTDSTFLLGSALAPLRGYRSPRV